MTNLEYLQKKFNEDERSSLHEIELDMSYRKVIALEIIAEELCKYTIREENKYSGECCEQSHDHTG